MKTISYIGNRGYSYADAAEMLLASHGYHTSAKEIEMVSGVGLGAHWVEEDKLLYFENWERSVDVGLKAAFRIMGFEVEQGQSSKKGAAPWEKIKALLVDGPVILGPIDAGYLNYLPDCDYQMGTDHFVLLYKIEKDIAFVHDPEGYPLVSLPCSQLEKAWRAAGISYVEEGFYYWAHPNEMKRDKPVDQFTLAIAHFQENYREGIQIAEKLRLSYGQKAIKEAISFFSTEKMSMRVYEHLAYFLFRFGTIRSLDYSEFFQDEVPLLAEYKSSQAHLLSQCHVAVVGDDLGLVCELLQRWAELEELFRSHLMKLST